MVFPQKLYKDFSYGKQYHQRTLLITFWPRLLSKFFYPLCQEEEEEQEVTCKGVYECCLAYLYSFHHLFLRCLVPDSVSVTDGLSVRVSLS